MHASVFALVRVRCHKARTVALRVGFLDKLDVYVGGRKVAAGRREFPAVWDVESFEIDLAQGVNDVILRTTKDRPIQYSVWVLSLAFFESDGSPAARPTFDDFAALPDAPERWREPWPFERAHVADY